MNERRPRAGGFRGGRRRRAVGARGRARRAGAPGRRGRVRALERSRPARAARRSCAGWHGEYWDSWRDVGEGEEVPSLRLECEGKKESPLYVLRRAGWGSVPQHFLMATPEQPVAPPVLAAQSASPVRHCYETNVSEHLALISGKVSLRSG